jgi:aldehyde dehydrogenase (NAD+)
LLAASTPAEVVAELRAHFDSGATILLGVRQGALSNLERLLVEHETALLEALREDLGKSPAEGWLTEVALTRQAIRDLKRRLPSFMATKKVRVPFVQRPGSASVQREPLGCCLVIAPWNYPVQLLLIPVATAIAAGNVVVAKPSELAPATSKALSSMFAEFDPHLVRVVEGDAEITQELIATGVDHIFFTGSSATGREVMRAAADHLTPVTLELGGKSPAYVDADADLGVSARRIVFAKFLNAGQSCVAPDYVLAHASILDQLVARIEKALTDFYGSDPEQSRDYGRIVNDQHFSRLAALVAGASEQIAIGGTTNPRSRYIAPTVVVRPPATSPLLREEIFGPVLPVIEVANLADAIASINSRPAPLAIYCFTNSEATLERIAKATRSGSITMNTAAEQFATMSLPFGGVGESGIGAYHAGAGLEQFSHERAYLRRGTKFETALAYPPSSGRKLAILKKALRA